MAFASEKPHILVVDDDDRIRSLLGIYLEKQGWIVSLAMNSDHAKTLLRAYIYDLMVLGVMMPGQSGFDMVRDLQQAGALTPVIFLTAKGEAMDRIAGLSLGADDYIVKPFDPKELVLRIEAILRRVARLKPDTKADIRLGTWIYDRKNGVLLTQNPEQENPTEDIALSESERDFLEALLETPNEAVSRHALSAKLGFDGNERSLDVQVNRLRKKLRDDGKIPQILKTVRGKGYMLRVDYDAPRA